MSLVSGARLGPYEILSPLGAGGMGEVYRAKDVRLAREVAIKVLPEEFFEGEERRQRFEREARMLASLNHPGIAAIHSFEEISSSSSSSTRHLLVMELVEGEDLAVRLASGALSLEETLSYARQIAEALEAAHEKGIVHRDLKPANVKVTPDGRVKLLDFGLAKMFEGDAVAGSAGVTHSPTLTARATAAGVILGTAAYMSPEQARGKTVDKRTDVWAFGCVLYEMLAGKRAFEGETVSDTLAAILKEEPDWSALPAGTPGRVKEILRKCLRRDAKQRLHDIADARLDLEELSAPGSSSSSGQLPFEEKTAAPSPTVESAERTSRERGSRNSLYLSWAIAAAFAVAAGVFGVLALRGRSPERKSVTKLTIPLPPGQVLSGNGGPAISRDGRMIAYSARDASGVARLYLRALDRFEPGTIPESEGAQQPFFSPDGSRVAFFARGKLFTASATGGAPAAIVDASAQPLGGTWGDDDTIVFSPALSSGLVRVPAAGGAVQQLTQPDEGAGGYAHGRPQFLPGSDSVLFTIWGASNSADRGPAVLSLATGKWQHASSGSGYWTGRYARSGHMLISGPRGVRAAPFDPDHPRVVNPQTFVVEEVLGTIAWSDSWFAVSDTGTLIYVPGDFLLGTLSWVDREGRVTPASEKPAAVSDPLLSPDGERIAFQDRDDVIWTKDLRRGSHLRLTPEGEGTAAYPVWSRDGTHVIFGSNRTGDWDIYTVPATGGPVKRLLARKGNQFPLSLAPDGTLLFNERSKAGPGADLLTLAPDGTVTPFLVAQPAGKVGGQFSPDGRAVAYASDESGRDEVYVRPYGRPGGAVAVSSEGGISPKWSPDGREIIYRRGDAFLAASVSSSGGVFSVGDSKKLFEVRAAPGRSTFQAGYSVAPDGRRFLVHLLDPRATPTRINVVLNWFEELNAKVPIP